MWTPESRRRQHILFAFALQMHREHMYLMSVGIRPSASQLDVSDQLDAPEVSRQLTNAKPQCQEQGHSHTKSEHPVTDTHVLSRTGGLIFTRIALKKF